MKTKRLISNKQQWLVDREFVELVHEIAFGDSAIDKDYSNEEVLVRLNEFAHESNKLEAIQECCRFETDDPDAELIGLKLTILMLNLCEQILKDLLTKWQGKVCLT